MWKLKGAVLILFLASVGAFIYYNFNYYTHRDTMAPEITLGSEEIRISVKDPEEKILSGCSAWDAVDGDVTQSMGVESLTDFIEGATREANIVAFDKAGHVSRTTRRVTYRDYVPVKFSLDGPLWFSISWGEQDILGRVHAQDCLDGDVSSLITFEGDEIINVSSAGDYRTSLAVVNSAGDTGVLPVTIHIYDPTERSGAAAINLKEYLIYIKKGQELEPLDYVDYITYRGTDYQLTQERGTFAIDTEYYTNDERKAFNKESKENPLVNIDKIEVQDGVIYDIPGTYEITYALEDLDHNRGEVSMIVIVEP